MTARSGRTANWCTFATWASRQAGQTIRKEDLRAKLQREWHLDARVTAIVTLIAAMARERGATASIDAIRETTIGQVISQVTDHAAGAVARGNKKVFEEIAFHFARFLSTCASDHVYTQQSLDAFLQQLRTGEPPEGQRYLRQAFSRYYAAWFEPDAKKKAEWNLLANLEIGLHEQTRLQPEIAAALNAGAIDPQRIMHHLSRLLTPARSITSGLRRLLLWTVGKTGLLEDHVRRLAELTSMIMRKKITEELMTLTFPQGKTLLLGTDVTGTFPALLMQPQETELLALLRQIDPTSDSVRLSGATDWSDLKERLHYICDLFRTSHENQVLFEEAFSTEQRAIIQQGKIPLYFEW